MDNKVRLWNFSVEDVDGNEYYLDDKGNEVDCDDAVGFTGTSQAASIEADRRANLFEENTRMIAINVTYHSLGVLLMNEKKDCEF